MLTSYWQHFKSGTDIRGVALDGVEDQPLDLTDEVVEKLAAAFARWLSGKTGKPAAALTVSLFAMTGKLIVLLIRQRFRLPDADALLWLLPGAVGGSLLAMLPALQGRQAGVGNALLRLSLFTSLLNIAAALT